MQICHSYSSKEQASFNPETAVTIHIDFEAQENEIWHCLHIFPISHQVIEPDAMIFIFLNVEFQASFFTVLFHIHQETL